MRAGIMVGGLLGAAAVHVAMAWPALDTTVDDAWISARYGRNVALGHGFVYNVGDPPVEGFTNLAWVLWAAVAHHAGIPMAGALTMGGLALGIAGLAAALGLAGALADDLHPRVLVAPVLLATSPHYAMAVTNGLETALFTTGLLTSLWWLLVARSLGGRGATGLAFAALAAVRPEGAGVAAVVLAWDLWTRRHTLDARTLAPLSTAAAGMAGLTLWRWSTFGALVPNTWAAKHSASALTLLPDNLRYLGFDGPYWFLLLPLALGAPWLPGRGSRRVPLALTSAVLLVAALQVELWMPATRLLVPVLALVTCILADALPAASPRVRRALGVGWVVALALLTGRNHGRDGRHSVLPDNPTGHVARHLAVHAPVGAVAVIVDAGWFAWHLGPDVRVLEAHPRALTQPHPQGAHLRIRELAPADPTFVILTQHEAENPTVYYGPDQAVFAGLDVPYDYLGRFSHHHRRYYDVYARADAHIPPVPESWVTNRLGPAPPR